MDEPISVMVVDDSEQVRASIKAMLELEEGFVVTAEAADGRTAVEMAQALRPDVILMDINMPGMDGIAATAAIMETAPTGIVIISVQGETDYLRRAMQAGCRDYLIKPFTAAELAAAIRRAAASPAGRTAARPARPRAQGKVITLFSTKGGVGKSILAANLATHLAARTRLRVAAVDLDLEFGVLAGLCGVNPVATWLDLARVEGPLAIEQVERVLARQGHNPLGVLAAPPMPHQAAEVDGEGRRDPRRNYVAEVLDLLRDHFDYVIIDTPTGFRESTLTALDRSDRILVVTVPEVPALQNAAKAMEILLERLEYPAAKVELVLNRYHREAILTPAEAEKGIGYAIRHTVAEDPRAAWSVSAGQPLALRRHHSPLAEDVARLAHRLLAEAGAPGPVPEQPAAGAGGFPVPSRGFTPAGRAPRPRLFGLF